jgi:hypothetical protein
MFTIYLHTTEFMKSRTQEYTILLSFNKIYLKHINNVTVLILLFHVLPIYVYGGHNW